MSKTQSYESYSFLEFIPTPENPYLVYSQASCDETINHLDTIVILYHDIQGFEELIPRYNTLGKKINNYINWVENNWNV